MMGFARQHKSTGNMLVIGSTTGEKLTFYRRSGDKRDEKEEDYGVKRSTFEEDPEMHERKSLVSDHTLFRKDYHDESAASELLLTPERPDNGDKWSSGAKLLGNKENQLFVGNDYLDERPTRDRYRRQGTKRELRPSKSIGDFSGSHQHQHHQQPPVASSKCNEFSGSSGTFFTSTFAVYDSSNELQPSKQRPRLLSVMDVTATPDRSRFIGSEKKRISSSASVVTFTGIDKADQHKLDKEDPYAVLVKFSSLSNGCSGHQEVTNKAATRLRLRPSRKVRSRFRSASLSSRINNSDSAMHSCKYLPQPKQGEVSLLNVSNISSEQMQQKKLMPDNEARHRLKQVNTGPGEQSVVELASQKSQGHPLKPKEKLESEDNGPGMQQVTLADAGFLSETKAHLSCGRRQPMHCFVDVGHLLLMQEQQQLTGAGRSSYYKGSNDNNTAGKTSLSFVGEIISEERQQDNKLDKSRAADLTIGSHDNANDNGQQANVNLTPSYVALPEAELTTSNCDQDTEVTTTEPIASTLAATTTRNTAAATTTSIDACLKSEFIAGQSLRIEQSAATDDEQQQLVGGPTFHYAQSTQQPAHQHQQRKSLATRELVSSQVANSEGGGQPIGSTCAGGDCVLLTMSTNSDCNNISKSRNNSNCGNGGLASELNNAASKLMGTCSQTWRQALQPNKSGSYKVARKQQVAAISVKETTNATNNLSMFSSSNTSNSATDRQQETIQRQSGDESANTLYRGESLRSTRFSRPGRSPISLQRQTNARLTRHKLKLQQQRQEQLLQLALRERQQLKSYSGQRRLESQLASNYTREFMQNHSQLIRANSNTRQVSSHSKRISINATLETANLDHHHQQQQQVILSTTNNYATPSTAIEICDNQLACSSRHFLNSASTPLDDQRSSYQETTNVIAYKPVKMLGNSGNNNNFSNNHRQNEDRESSTSDDAQTISSSSSSSLSLNKPFCKVCHIGNGKNGDKLISPCRCSGTMQYIHCGCLLKWLEISNRSNEKPMSCELCAHEYSWHKKFNFKQMQLPKCSIKDIFLHLIFIAALGVMLFSALSPILQKSSPQQVSATSSNKALADQLSSSNSFKTTNEPDQSISRYRRPLPSASYHHSSFNGHSSTTSHHLSSGHLAQDEKYILMCAASFFISFFLAIYVQTKARDTLCSLIIKFLSMNQTYYITEYDHGQLSQGSNNKHHHQQQQQNNNEISRYDRKISAQQKS